jgi:hypothetical protein
MKRGAISAMIATRQGMVSASRAGSGPRQGSHPGRSSRWIEPDRSRSRTGHFT